MITPGLSQVVQMLPEPTVLVESDGRIVAANDGAVLLAGVGPGPLCGQMLAAFVRDSPAKLEQYLRCCAAASAAIAGTLTWKSDPDGAELRCEGSVIQAGRDGEPAVIMLRCRPRSQSSRHYTLLEQKISELSRTVAQCQCAEAAIRRATTIQAMQGHVLESLAGDGSLEDVLYALVEMLEQQTPGLRGAIMLVDESHRCLRHVAAPHVPDEYRQRVDGLEIASGNGSCGTAAATGRRVIVEDTLTDPLWARFRDLAVQFDIRACWSQPIVSRAGKILGTVGLYWHGQPRRPGESELGLMDIAARLAALAIERRQAIKDLQDAKNAAEAANRAKDQFLAVLSHELRTPLSPALATLYALEQQITAPDLHEDIAMVRRNLELETRLIDDMLDLTRITRGKLELTLQPIDLHAKLRNVLRIVENDAQSKNVIVKLHLQAARHRILGDSARIQQVFWNLLRNAIKFTPAGGLVVVRTSNAPPDHVVVEVIDSGIGIAPEFQARIFEPFEQGDRIITKAFGGLGLGLAIARNIVNLHGGRITARSEGKGKGATFTVELATCLGDSADDPEAPRAAGGDVSRALRILLVEDHEDTARVLVRFLRRSGHDVHVADSVGSARRAWEADSFDLLVSDLGLPDGSGLDLVRQLRAQGPVRAIALSGFGMDEDIHRSQEAGFTEHLTKPVHPQELKAAIARITCGHLQSVHS